MEECKQLLEFVKDFLEDNKGNSYRKYLGNMFYVNIESRVKEIEQKYKSLEALKLGKSDKIIEDKKCL